MLHLPAACPGPPHHRAEPGPQGTQHRADAPPGRGQEACSLAPRSLLNARPGCFHPDAQEAERLQPLTWDAGGSVEQLRETSEERGPMADKTRAGSGQGRSSQTPGTLPGDRGWRKHGPGGSGGHDAGLLRARFTAGRHRSREPPALTQTLWAEYSLWGLPASHRQQEGLKSRESLAPNKVLSTPSCSRPGPICSPAQAGSAYHGDLSRDLPRQPWDGTRDTPMPRGRATLT